MNTIKIEHITIPCKAITELGASAAVLLAFLCEVHRKYERKNELLDRGFFPCTRQELTDAIGMLRRQQENAIAELSDLKYIKVKANQPGFNGGIRLFRVNKEALIGQGYYKETQPPLELQSKPSLVSGEPNLKTPVSGGETKSKKKQKIQTEGLDLFSLFGEDDTPQPVFNTPEKVDLERSEPVSEPSQQAVPVQKDELLIHPEIQNQFVTEKVDRIDLPEKPIKDEAPAIDIKEHTHETNKSTFFDDHNWITNPSNIIYHPQSQMQQQLAEKIRAILTKDIDIYSKCSDLLTILGIRAQLEYFDMHNLSKCGDTKIQQTIDALLNFAKIAPSLSPIFLKFHQAILVEIIKFIIKGHNRSILSFEYRTESPQPKKELQQILLEHYSDYQFNINIV